MKGKPIKVSYIVITIALILCVVVGIVVFHFGTVDDDHSPPIGADGSATSDQTPQPSESTEPDNTDSIPAITPAGQYDPVETGDLETTYTIENARFGIDSTGQHARATTDGINEALQWAKSQGYNTINFVEGTYLIQCKWRNRFIPPTDGILVPSGLTLDLGHSTFVMETNSYPEYAIFAIVSESDVTIKNGKLMGDIEGHVYEPSKSSPTHEYGFGICISASSNVTIQGVTIQNMTGDGVIIEGSYSKLADGGSVSSNIRILDCNISKCRRQGISVVGVTDGEIARNNIYDIGGTAPEYGIVIMPNLDYMIEDIRIFENNIYDCVGGAIACNKGRGFKVFANVCNGNIVVVYASGVEIYENVIQNSYIQVMPGGEDITVVDNILEGNSWLQIEKETP